MKDTSEKEWEEELCSRIRQIEQEESSIRHMKKKDYITAGILAALCLFTVLAGALI